MKRKLISILLILLLSAGYIPVLAEETDSLTRLVSALDIMKGDPDGNFRLQDNVTRAEFTKIAIAASAYRNSVAAGMTISPFYDVSYRHWAAPYIQLAVSNQLVNGYEDSTFRPENNVTFEEALTIFLKLLGYTNDDFGASWPYGQIGMANSLKMTEHINRKVGEVLTRSDVMQMVYNLLQTEKKGSNEKYITVLDCELIENVTLIATSQQDSSIGIGKIYTSGGTYDMADSFVPSHLGQEGDLILQNKKEVLHFHSYSEMSADSLEQYLVYSTLDNKVITYQGGHMNELEIQDNVTAYKETQKTSFGALKGTLSLGDVIYVSRDDRGNISHVTVVTGNVEGPITVKGNNWVNEFSASAPTVTRDGEKSSIGALQPYDIAYYVKDLNMILAYSKKITGIYEKATPNKDLPTSVVVSGVTYDLESVAAFNALSSNGTFKYGDTVTLLIGKTGQIADVVDPSVLQKDIYGYMTGSGKKSFLNNDGNTYSSNYVSLVMPDGTSYELATKTDYSMFKNSVVKVVYQNGVATISKLESSSNISGTVDADRMTIGNFTLAGNVSILDVSTTDSSVTGAYVNVFPQRLDGVVLSSSSVLYAERSQNGTILSLILKDVTGDMYEYGMITYAKSNLAGSSVGGSYTYDIGGTSTTVNTSNKAYSVSAGRGAKFVMSGGRMETMTNIPGVKGTIQKLTDTYIELSDGEQMLLASDVVAYQVDSYLQYMLIPLSDARKMTGRPIYAYYDSDQKHGGRVRIIVIGN